MNATSKTWNSDDYMEGYCQLGKQAYLTYRKFKNNYELDHASCMAILGKFENGSAIKEFYEGRFQIYNYKEAVEFAERLNLIGQYYQGNKRRIFIRAMLTLFKNERFEFMEFLNKLRLNPSSLTDCNTVSQYITLIEEIYNYRRRDKVNLRY